ncbi:hypothetical protein [Phenylobacterium sp.]|uniref:hypothetical protein n=1 Tax=Phenylobacterium sp. TaxID=1871053 RepID=UPI0025EBC64B|nr:hypothetical protein [Phenylobacterium sp.]
MSGYTLYPPEPMSEAAVRAVLALAPMALLTAVGFRMGRGWLVSSLPWILVGLAAAIYAVPAVRLFAGNGVVGTFLLFLHLIEKIGPFVTILGLAVLATLGAKKASNKSEPA